MRKWNDLPKEMQVEQVKKYYEILQCHKGSLLAKRIFDIIVASLLVVILSPILFLLSILIKIDSPGPGDVSSGKSDNIWKTVSYL